MTPGGRRVLAAAPGGIILAALVALVYKVDHAYRPALRAVPFSLHWGTLLLASAVWLAGYTQLVQLWGASLAWWGSRPLRWRAALRVFCVSNLARYIPGAVWQFAGLAALAAAEGASPAAASVGVLLEQVVLLGTGFALVLSVAPSFLARWTYGLGLGAELGIAALLIAALVVGLPHLLPRARAWAEGVIKRPLPLPSIPHGPFAIYVIRGALSWVIYGVAFWLFARALMGPAAPGVWLSATAYVASYLVGLLAIIAPGGIVVREGALVLCLTSTIGAQPAIILAVTSRLWLIALEVFAALAVLAADAVRHRRRRRMTN